MKGNATCHTTNKKFREGWDRIFALKPSHPPEGVKPVCTLPYKCFPGSRRISRVG